MKCYLLNIIATLTVSLHGYQAFICVPVADASTDKTHQSYSVQQRFKEFALDRFSGDYGAVRTHQLLFNERVDVIESAGDECLIEAPQAFFETATGSKKYFRYWILSTSCCPLSKSAVTRVPMPFTYRHYNHTSSKEIALKDPYTDRCTGITYSAGTRFVVKAYKKRGALVWIFNPHSHTWHVAQIPHKHYVHPPFGSRTTKQKRYVNLVKQWATTSSVVPYVWGGTSVVHRCNNHNFYHTPAWYNVQPTRVFTCDACAHAPRTGMDCAGLVLRGAQTAGLPYFFKNTNTPQKYLRTVTAHDTIEPGDLLIIRGHVAIVADVDNTTIIEERDYKHGYGKLHEIRLEEQFDGVTSYTQLKQMFLEHKPLKRKKKDGTIVQVYPTFTILKMSSCWDNIPTQVS